MIPNGIIKDMISGMSLSNMAANITTLQAFQTRHCGWTNAQEVADAVSAMFTAVGYEPTQDKWLDYDHTGNILEYGTLDIINVIGEIRGVVYPDKIIVVSAHHDSWVNFAEFEYDGSYGLRSPGADDNASGVCAMIEMARLIKANNWNPDYTIRFIAFSGEEQGSLGSQLYLENTALGDDIILNINLDMLGWTDSLSIVWDMILHPYDTDDNALDSGNSYHDLSEIIIPEVTTLSVTRGDLNPPGSDSFRFYQNGFPAIYFEENPQTANYHTEDDTLANMNQDYYLELAKAALACLISFANLQLRFTTMPTTTDFRAAMSTLHTLTQWEKEINAQAGYTRKWGLLSTSTSTYTVTTLNTVAYAVATLLSGFTQTVAGVGGASLDGVIPIPTAQVTSIACYNSSNVLLDTFSLNESGGVTVYGSDGVLTGAVSNSAAWVLGNENRTWQDKIDLAAEILQNDLETILTERQIIVDEAGGDDLIDVITNPDTFRIACDYKALALIYSDLANSGFNELFAKKAVTYAQKYDLELSSAIKRMNLDPSLSGTTTEYRAEFSARVTR